MSQNPPTDVNDTDKLMAALAYFFPVIVPAIILLVETMKARPYQKYHAVQSLGLSVAELVFVVVLCILSFVCGIGASALAGPTQGTSTLLACIPQCIGSLVFLVPLILNIYYAIIAYVKVQYFEIPVVTKFMVQQHWLTQ